MAKLRGVFLLTLMIAVPAMAEDVRIDIKAFMFAPVDVHIDAGARVTWFNDDDDPHTVSETHKLFRSGALDTDQSFTYQFDSPGTFDYFCTLHPEMVGKIVVGAGQ